MNRRIDQILFQKEKSLWVKIFLLPFSLLSIPYGWAVRARTSLYAKGLQHPLRLPCPVISVGNITVGGTGKTPLVMALAKELKAKGIPVAILSRGYKGRKGSGPIVSDGKRLFLSPGESGDEPYLMGKTLEGIPVLIGRNRFANGRMALERFGVRGLLLDDGYQHLGLHRNLDILLIDAQIGFGDAHLLPRGILREPLSHLRRADLFLLTKAESPEACFPLEAILRKIHPSAPVFHSHYEALGLVGPEGHEEQMSTVKGMKVLALSAIGNPAYFSSLLKKHGLEVVRELSFPDHHPYSSRDLLLIENEGKGVDRVVTTQKDMVKLKDLQIRLRSLRALSIEVRIWEEGEFYKRVMERFGQKGEKQ